MGLAMMGMSNYDEALAQVPEEIRLGFNLLVNTQIWAGVYSAEGKSDEAVRWYQTALKLNPWSGAAYYYLGMEASSGA